MFETQRTVCGFWTYLGDYGSRAAAQTNQTNQTYTRRRDLELNPAPLRGHFGTQILGILDRPSVFQKIKGLRTLQLATLLPGKQKSPHYPHQMEAPRQTTGPSEEAWERMRPVIIAIYREQTLRVLVQRLREEYKFPAT